MTERLIYRPNSFTPEAWGGLSRDDQIRWWKDRQPKPKPVSPLIAIGLYEKGQITKIELPNFVFEHLTEENVADVLTACPDEILCILRQTASSLPDNEDSEGWGQLLHIEGACYPPWVTDDEIRQSRQARAQRFREGVRYFRKSARV